MGKDLITRNTVMRYEKFIRLEYMGVHVGDSIIHVDKVRMKRDRYDRKLFSFFCYFKRRCVKIILYLSMGEKVRYEKHCSKYYSHHKS